MCSVKFSQLQKCFSQLLLNRKPIWPFSMVIMSVGSKGRSGESTMRNFFNGTEPAFYYFFKILHNDKIYETDLVLHLPSVVLKETFSTTFGQ